MSKLRRKPRKGERGGTESTATVLPTPSSSRPTLLDDSLNDFREDPFESQSVQSTVAPSSGSSLVTSQTGGEMAPKTKIMAGKSRDKMAGKVGSDQEEGEGEEEPDENSPPLAACPFCGKESRSAAGRTAHVKTCAGKNGIGTERLLEVLRLEKRQATERAALGLPNLTVRRPLVSERSKQPPTERSKQPTQQRTKQRFEEGADPDLELALALSISAQAAERPDPSRHPEPPAASCSPSSCPQLTAAGGEQHGGISEATSSRTQSSQSKMWLPQAPQNPVKVRKKRGKAVRGPTVLETRTQAERERLIGERVAHILDTQETAPYTRRHERTKHVISARLAPLSNSPTSFWSIARIKSSPNTLVSRKLALFICDDVTVSDEVSTKAAGEAVMLKENSLSPGRAVNSSQLLHEAVNDSRRSHRAGNRLAQNVDVNGKQLPCEAAVDGKQLPCEAAVPQPSFQRLSNNWLALLGSGRATDLRLICRNEAVITCHKVVFAARCPTFLTDLIEERSGDARTDYILLSDYDSIVIKVFLDYVYGGIFTLAKLNQPTHLSQLSQLARRYRLPELTECLSHLEIIEYEEEEEGDSGDSVARGFMEKSLDDPPEPEPADDQSLASGTQNLEALLSLMEDTTSSSQTDNKQLAASGETPAAAGRDCAEDFDDEEEESWDNLCLALTQKSRGSITTAESDGEMAEGESGDERGGEEDRDSCIEEFAVGNVEHGRRTVEQSIEEYGESNKHATRTVENNIDLNFDDDGKNVSAAQSKDSDIDDGDAGERNSGKSAGKCSESVIEPVESPEPDIDRLLNTKSMLAPRQRIVRRESSPDMFSVSDDEEEEEEDCGADLELIQSKSKTRFSLSQISPVQLAPSSAEPPVLLSPSHVSGVHQSPTQNMSGDTSTGDLSRGAGSKRKDRSPISAGWQQSTKRHRPSFNDWAVDDSRDEYLPTPCKGEDRRDSYSSDKVIDLTQSSPSPSPTPLQSSPQLSPTALRSSPQPSPNPLQSPTGKSAAVCSADNIPSQSDTAATGDASDHLAPGTDSTVLADSEDDSEKQRISCRLSVLKDRLDNKVNMLESLSELMKMTVTVESLLETGIGRVVRQLRHREGEVGQAAQRLVNQWKKLVINYAGPPLGSQAKCTDSQASYNDDKISPGNSGKSQEQPPTDGDFKAAAKSVDDPKAVNSTAVNRHNHAAADDKHTKADNYDPASSADPDPKSVFGGDPINVDDGDPTSVNDIESDDKEASVQYGYDYDCDYVEPIYDDLYDQPSYPNDNNASADNNVSLDNQPEIDVDNQQMIDDCINSSSMWRSENEPVEPAASNNGSAIERAVADVMRPAATSMPEGRRPATTPVNRRLQLAAQTPQCTPLPNYEAMLTPALRAELKRFGLKAVPRRKAVLFLRHIYDQTHPIVDGHSSPVSSLLKPAGGKSRPIRKAPAHNPAKSQPIRKLQKKNGAKTQPTDRREVKTRKQRSEDPEENDEEDDDDFDLNTSRESQGSQLSDNPEETCPLDEEEEDGITPSQVPTEANLHERLRDFITSRPSLHQTVLLYEPIWLNEFIADVKEAGIKCKNAQIMDFLDQECITFRSESRRASNRQKKSPKKKSPKKNMKKSPKKLGKKSSNNIESNIRTLRK